ncbi:hypothetical protein HY627_01695 [Candidatus Uhrbacteria bacterium]|nr:hypothetical protein [Candidatus Uhrbacteria bacterium]
MKGTIPILVRDTRTFFSAIEKDRILEVLERFADANAQRVLVRRIALTVSIAKTPCENPRAVHIVLTMLLASGKILVASAEAHDATLAFRQALNKLRLELTRLHDSRIAHRTRAWSPRKSDEVS